MGKIRRPAEEPRHETRHRAGTPLESQEPIFGRVNGRETELGRYDSIQRIFQTGGKAGNFIYWKLRVYSMPIETWQSISTLMVDRIEWVDHQKNIAYSCRMEDASLYGVEYEDARNSIGRRFGVPTRFVSEMTGHEDVKPPIREVTPDPIGQLGLFT